MPAPAQLRLTPTPRLARDLARRQAQAAHGQGVRAWLTDTVLPFSSWLVQLHSDALLVDPDCPVPIDDGQSALLWRRLIDDAVFVGESRIVELAQRAWRQIHDHRLTPPEDWPEAGLHEDAGSFRRWARRYRQACADAGVADVWQFAVSLPARLADGALPLPERILLCGFELPLTPLQAEILDACRSAGVEVVDDHGGREERSPVDLFQYPEPDDELLAATRWARERLHQDPHQQLAIVVPDLAARLERVEGICRQVLDPPAAALEAPASPAWHLSLGRPLDQWPLVADALQLLALGPRTLVQPQLARILRSPFLAGDGATPRSRHAALAQLTQAAPFRVTLVELGQALERAGADDLAEALGRWRRLREQPEDTRWPGQWVGRFQQELSELGFAAGRSLDSREYQVLQRWHGVLEAFAALDLVCEQPLTRSEAMDLLRTATRTLVFREHNPGVPLEILGVQEALGARFDGLWLTALDNDGWPAPARREPLLPGFLQAGLPGADADAALTLAQRQLDGLRRCAPEVLGSFSLGPDEPRQPTRLLAADDLRAGAPRSGLVEAAPPAAPLEAGVEDARAPAVREGPVAGGAGVLRSQSDCPFRALAERRLGAVALEPARPGLSPSQRGTVVHRMLERFWHDLPDQQALAALDPSALEALAERAIQEALNGLNRRFRLTLGSHERSLEYDRCRELLDRWLEVERARPPFTVVAREAPVRLRYGGLQLDGKVDRIDRLADDSLLVMDYKTGAVSAASWDPAGRLPDPQLPAYALALDPPARAVAFASIRADAPRFVGLAAQDTKIRGVDAIGDARRKFVELSDWQALCDAWQSQLEALADEFTQGHAAVAPRQPSVCQRCHLPGLCRITERTQHYGAWLD